MGVAAFRYGRIARSSTCPPGGFRGALHCHTVGSDGNKTVDELIAMYRSLGYSFMCVTDHSVAGTHGGHRGDDFLVIDGVEVVAKTDGGRMRHESSLHVVAINVSRMNLGLVVSLKRALGGLFPKGALIFAAHPHWTNNTHADIAGKGFHGVELYNYGCARETGKSDGVPHWDYALGQGEDLLGFAVDDCHCRAGLPDVGGGWVGVFANRLDKASILGALRRGLFYSLTGPIIYDIALRDGKITVRTSPVTIARLVGFNGYHRSIVAGRPEPLDGDPNRLCNVTTSPLPSSDAIRERFRYVRFECEDEATGKKAWTNTLFRLGKRG